jgi:hypothetical protein
LKLVIIGFWDPEMNFYYFQGDAGNGLVTRGPLAEENVVNVQIATESKHQEGLMAQA